MTNTSSRFIVSDGALAGDIKQELVSAGSPHKVRKIQPNEPIGEYGEYLFEAPTQDAVFIALRYPDFVRGLP